MDDLFLVVLLLLSLFGAVGYLLVLVFGYLTILVFRSLRRYAGFLAWRFGSKQMRQEVAVSYMFAIAYTLVFLFDLAGNILDTLSGWLICAILWPLSVWVVVSDHYTYFATIAPLKKPA